MLWIYVRLFGWPFAGTKGVQLNHTLAPRVTSFAPCDIYRTSNRSRREARWPNRKLTEIWDMSVYFRRLQGKEYGCKGDLLATKCSARELPVILTDDVSFTLT